jgi:hypothetical protein
MLKYVFLIANKAVKISRMGMGTQSSEAGPKAHLQAKPCGHFEKSLKHQHQFKTHGNSRV